MSLLWIRVTAEHEDYPPTYYHVSPNKIPVGEHLRPPGRGWTNWDQSSGEHTYFTPSRDRAEQYRYELWEQGHPKQHLHEVEPLGTFEQDPHDEESFRTRAPVKVTYHVDADDEDDDEEKPPEDTGEWGQKPLMRPLRRDEL